MAFEIRTENNVRNRGDDMRFLMRFAFLMIILGLATVSVVAGAPSSWQVGSYWTYQELLQVQSFSRIPTSTFTYYVVARTDLLDTTMCAVTRIDKSSDGKKVIALSPLTIQVFESGTLKPQVWPFPAQGAPIIVAKKKTSMPGGGSSQMTEAISPMMVTKGKGAMLGEGCSQMTETTYPQGKGKFIQQFEIQQDGVEKVTVPAGVFPNAIRFDYQEKINMPASVFPGSQQSPGQSSWQTGGTAWWSNKIAAWVRIEEHGQEQGSHVSNYTWELSDWGRLSEKNLKAQLSAALTDFASANPVIAVIIGQQLQKVGLNLDNGG